MNELIRFEEGDLVQVVLQSNHHAYQDNGRQGLVCIVYRDGAMVEMLDTHHKIHWFKEHLTLVGGNDELVLRALGEGYLA